MESYLQATGSVLFLILIVVIGIGNRIYWESKKRRKQLQTQIDMLAQIAVAQGVDKNKIAEIVALVRMETK